MLIHPQSIVSPRAKIGPDVSIGPFCVVEEDVEIGRGSQLASHSVIKSGTRMGKNNHVSEFAVLGGKPQHLQLDETSGRLWIGDENTIREHVTIHRSLKRGDDTIVGDHNLIMVGAHVAHDCVVGNHTIFANNVMLAGHVTVGNRAYISGAAGVHQFCRIGEFAMVGGQARIVKDVPPFVTVDGDSSCIVGLNRIGLRRNGFTLPDMRQLKAAYRLIYRSRLPFSEVVDRLREEFPAGPAADFHTFFLGGTRGFTPPRMLPEGATLRLREDHADEASRVA